jgi:hypothetical protein
MGRGRQKAKDAKIARQLKYTPIGTDLRALERELIGGGVEGSPINPSSPLSDDDADPEDLDVWDEDEDDER